MTYRDLTLDGDHAAHCADWEEQLRLRRLERLKRSARRAR